MSQATNEANTEEQFRTMLPDTLNKSIIPDNHRSSANWPGMLEHILIYLIMPIVWIALLVLAMIAFWGLNLTTGIVASFVAGVLIMIVFVIAYSRYHRDHDERKKHWDSLLFRPELRLIAIGHVPLLAIVLIFFSSNSSQPVKLNVAEQPKNEGDTEKFWAQNKLKPYGDNNETEGRGRLAIQGDATDPKSNIKKVNYPQNPNPNSAPSGTTPEQPSISISFYFPPNTSPQNQTKVITRTGPSPNPDFFILNGIPIPIALVAAFLGIGDSVTYRETTLQTVSQTLDGNGLKGDVEAKMINELQKHPDRIDAWGTSAKKVIDGATGVDDDTKARAKSKIDAVIDKAKKTAENLAKTALPIVETIKKHVDNTPSANKKDIDDLIAAAAGAQLSPELKYHIRTLLEKAGKKYLDAWDNVPAAPPKT